MSQRDGVPPEERTERKDINTRKVIDVLETKLGDKLGELLDERLKGVVMWERLTVILGTAAVIIITAAWVVTTMASQRAEARAATAESGVATLRKDTGEAVQLVREELKETRGDIRSVYRAIRTNQPQPRLAAPVPALPPNPITPEEK